MTASSDARAKVSQCGCARRKHALAGAMLAPVLRPGQGFQGRRADASCGAQAHFLTACRTSTTAFSPPLFHPSSSLSTQVCRSL